MSDETQFSCDSCGKVYKWQPQLAGKKAKCKCGSVLVVPAQAPGSRPELQDPPTSPPPEQPVAKAEEKKSSGCPECGAALADGAVLCIQCGFNLKTGQKMGAAVVAAGAAAKKSKAAREDDEEQEGEDGPPQNKLQKRMDREIPIGLSVAGLAVFALAAWLTTQATGYKGDGFGSEAGQLVLQAAVGAAMMVGVVFLGTRLMEIPTGAVGLMALKTVGIYLFAASLATVLPLVTGDAGWFLGAFLLLGVQIGLFMWFFAVDFLTAWIFAAIGYLVKELIVLKIFGGTF